VRNSRLITRISLILVILMGLFGGWYAARNWQPDLASFDASIVTEDTDWMDVVAGLGEEAVQLLLGLTSDDP
jgi:hypothetical protein